VLFGAVVTFFVVVVKSCGVTIVLFGVVVTFFVVVVKTTGVDIVLFGVVVTSFVVVVKTTGGAIVVAYLPNSVALGSVKQRLHVRLQYNVISLLCFISSHHPSTRKQVSNSSIHCMRGYLGLYSLVVMTAVTCIVGSLVVRISGVLSPELPLSPHNPQVFLHHFLN